MTFVDFINKYIGKKIDFDGAYGAQCVDVFRQYCKDVLNIPHTGSVVGAKDLYLKYDNLPLEKKYFKKFSNIKDFSFGDVIIWNKTESNIYGHVAIFITSTDEKSVVVFEQNGFKQDGSKIAIKKVDNLLGALRFKGGN